VKPRKSCFAAAGGNLKYGWAAPSAHPRVGHTPQVEISAKDPQKFGISCGGASHRAHAVCCTANHPPHTGSPTAMPPSWWMSRWTSCPLPYRAMLAELDGRESPTHPTGGGAGACSLSRTCDAPQTCPLGQLHTLSLSLSGGGSGGIEQKMRAAADIVVACGADVCICSVSSAAAAATALSRSPLPEDWRGTRLYRRQ
jgi:hypothetical protein